uniref:RNase H type-1 domain-containing protein n=1 Tax=Triticum urartu TaxID=4572 RepID=A0A8R7UYI7_TRIUA
MILRDNRGRIIFSSCRYLFTCDDVLETEIMGIRKGLLLALQWSNLPIDVESDSLQAVNMVQSAETNRSKYAFMIKEIKNLLIERNSCITHIVRSKNNASHFLANFGRP